MSRRASRLPGRAWFVYAGTIVLPVVVLLWLGLQSFERQREALETLAAEKVNAELAARIHAAAEAAFADRTHPLVRYGFVIEHGQVVEPALTGLPLPRWPPPEFAAAERQEVSRPDLALASYRRLLSGGTWDSLALSRVARCLAALGRDAEAREAWQKLATEYPDERDLSGRPFGIVAAINSGETAGLYDEIEQGRWNLAEEQAEYFLSVLDPARESDYLDRFRFARELNERFAPPAAPGRGEILEDTVGEWRVFYREDEGGRIAGFAADTDWIERTLRPAVEQDVFAAAGGPAGPWVYGGSIGVVLLLLLAGAFLLWRDVARETRTNQLRADLVSGVTHELKTPITLIRLYGETLLRHGELDAQTRREACRVITRESTRLGRLVDQVLTFSRIERGETVYALEEGDLAAVVAGVVDDYAEWLERAGFSLERTIPTSVPTVRFDPAAVSQAVLNLVDNAVKYSGPAREVGVRLADAGGRVTVEVEDHGAGIPPEEQSRIFDRYYRVDNARGKGGYGLGLFMVRHIMEAHGGQVEVESAPGQGSRFRLVFPVAAS